MTREKSDILVNILLFLVSLNMFLILFVSFVPGNDISGFIFEGYGHVCHQGEQGILFGKTVPLPLCYRCLGMHVFFFIGAWLYILYFFRKGKIFSFLFLILFSLPIIIDGLFKISKQLNNHYVSFITGALFGFACIVCILQGLKAR